MALFTGKRLREQPSHENPYWMSFSDMMSGMLIIFILICIALLYQLTQMKEKYFADLDELRKSNRMRAELIREIKEELAKKNIKVYVSDNDTVLRIPDRVITFAPNEPAIMPEYKKNAEEIGRALSEAIAKYKRWEHLDTVFVEGHADITPVRGDPRGNWDLSTRRAVSLWQFWLENPDFGPWLRDVKNKADKRLFSVSGYADTRPPEEDGNPKTKQEALQRQRRIDIRFTTRQPSFLEYEKAGSALKGLTSKP